VATPTIPPDSNIERVPPEVFLLLFSFNPVRNIYKPIRKYITPAREIIRKRMVSGRKKIKKLGFIPGD
jgi:hypothetical protein